MSLLNAEPWLGVLLFQACRAMAIRVALPCLEHPKILQRRSHLQSVSHAETSFIREWKYGNISCIYLLEQLDQRLPVTVHHVHLAAAAAGVVHPWPLNTSDFIHTV
jgi:hypothetical protein